MSGTLDFQSFLLDSNGSINVVHSSTLISSPVYVFDYGWN